MKKNNSHIALGAHNKHLKWTFIPNGSSIFILMQQGKRNSYLIDVPCIQSFHIGILQIDIFLYIHKWSSSLNNGKYTGYKFIPYDIDCCHLRLTLCLPANIVVMQLSIKMDSRHRRQMKKPLHLLVGYGTYLCPGMDTCSGLILKGSNAGIAGKFSPIFKPCEITGIHYQERGNDESNSLDCRDKFKGSLQFFVRHNDRSYLPFQFMHLILESRDNVLIDRGQYGEFPIWYNPKQFVSRGNVATHISHHLVAHCQQRMKFPDILGRKLCRNYPVVEAIGKLRYPLSIYLVVLPSGNTQRTFDIQRRNHRVGNVFTFKKQSERQRIESGMFKTNKQRFPSFSNMLLNPLDKLFETRFFIPELAMNTRFSDKGINTQFRNINTNIIFVQHNK